LRFAVVPAVHLLLGRGDEVLLQRRFNTGYEDGNYSVPAGHLDGGEPATLAMVREAREETGITLAPADLAVAHVMHRHEAGEERFDLFLAAAAWAGEPRIMEPHKCDELRWCRPDALPPNTVPYVRAALAAVARSAPYSEFGWSV
jgi:8-oxo-dGTP diphosphatase